jgi:glycosyltransferase involved in cell wall biosynthesis
MFELGHPDRLIDHPRRLRMIAEMLIALSPEVVLNVYSHAAWDCFLLFGHQLARRMRLIAAILCDGRTERGGLVGYGVSYFPQTVPYLHRAITDTQGYADLLVTRNRLSDRDKARCVYTPVDDRPADVGAERFERLRRPASYRRQVMWAGRITRQKNPQMLFEIVRRMPECDFQIFGFPSPQFPVPALPNLIFNGPFARFNDLPHSRSDLFLYTSLWDGMPNVLVEAATQQLPIVAPLVDGIGELVTEATGWPVDSPNDVDAFVAQLRKICFEFDAAGGSARVAAMTQLVRERHSFAAFVRTLDEALR